MQRTNCQEALHFSALPIQESGTQGGGACPERIRGLRDSGIEELMNSGIQIRFPLWPLWSPATGGSGREERIFKGKKEKQKNVSHRGHREKFRNSRIEGFRNSGIEGLREPKDHRGQTTEDRKTQRTFTPWNDLGLQFHWGASVTFFRKVLKSNQQILSILLFLSDMFFVLFFTIPAFQQPKA